MRLGDAGWAVVLLSIVALVAPGVAGAHLRIGEVAVDARVTIDARPSNHDGFDVSVRESDRSFTLTVQPGHRVVVLGYLAELFLRVDGRGVAVSLASPTAAEAGLVPAGGRRHTGWSTTTPGLTAVWRDPRVQRLAPGVDRVSWAVPLEVDGRHTQITGVLLRVRRPSLWPWALVVLAGAMVGFGLAIGRRRRRLSTGCIALGSLSSVAALVTAGAFAVDGGAPGARIAAVYAFVLIAPAAGALVLAPPVARVPAGTWLAVIGLTTTLVDSGMFVHGFLLSALPATVTRAAGALAVGSGLAGAVLGGLFIAGESQRLT